MELWRGHGLGASSYTAEREAVARMLDGLRKDNCSFKKVQILSHNIGYLKLDAFLDPSACVPRQPSPCPL
jgi:hypothetical protein